MINVFVISNVGNGERGVYQMANGSTLGDCLDLFFPNISNWDNWVIKHENEPVNYGDADDIILVNDDKVSVMPKKVEGA